MKAPQISIIVPLYKEFRWLAEALGSIRDSRFEDWETILVNDGSPEDPKPIVKDFLKDPRFHYIEQARGGSAAARNFGLRSACGKWVAFLDQDDRLLPDRFVSQMAFASGQGENVAGIYSDYERIDESGKILDRYTSRSALPNRLVREALSERGLVAIGTVLIRKQWIDRANGFDPGLSGYEETDLVVRIALIGGSFAYLPGVVYQWRNHPGNTMKSLEFQEERRLRFVAKLERLSEAYSSLKNLLPGFRARSWHKIGLFRAESGAWGPARKWGWKAWKEDPRRWSALYLAAKAWLKG